MTDPSVPTTPENPTPPPTTEVTPSPSNVVESGIVIYPTARLEIGSTLYGAVQMGGRIDLEIKRVLHIPRTRQMVNDGMEILATLQGLLYRQLCDHWSYDPKHFMDAVEKYSMEQEKLRMDREQNKEETE